MPFVTVIIPFFQQERGILLPAVESVFAQKVNADVRIDLIVIDDGSPVPASEELAHLAPPVGFTLSLLKCQNGGPGWARNIGLDMLSDKTDFVGFLDSDDRWRADHLQTALNILDDDADFYFCDHTRWYDEKSWFRASEPIQLWMKENDGGRFVARPEFGIYEFVPKAAFLSFIEDYLAQTSTVVYRYARFRNIRFDTQLRHAGEDNMFWLELSEAARRVRFSTTARVHCGRGDNMYYGSMSWDHPDAARRIGYVLVFFRKVESKFQLKDAARVATKQRIRTLEATFAHIWIRKILKTRVFDWNALRPVVREDPWLLPKLLPLGFVALYRFIRRKIWS